MWPRKIAKFGQGSGRLNEEVEVNGEMYDDLVDITCALLSGGHFNQSATAQEIVNKAELIYQCIGIKARV